MPQRDVDEAIAYVSTQNAQPFSSPLESQIRNYFQAQSHNGYNVLQIKNSLLNQGYPPIIVNKIAEEFSTVNLKHEVHFSKGTIIGILLVIIVASISYFSITTLFNKSTTSLLDVSISTDKYTFNPGDFITFQVHATNMGSKDRFDVILKYTILDESNKAVANKDETIALQTSASLDRNIMIPSSVQQGKYKLQVTASYGSNNAKSTSEFEVVPKSSIKNNATPPIILPQNTTITNPNDIPAYVPPATVNTGINTGKTFGELLSSVKATSKTDPESVVSDCSNLASLDQKYICFSVIADSSESYEYCSRVDNLEYKDNCYLSFVLKGNLDVCQYITDKDNKAFCDQLRLVQLMNQYYQDNDTAKVLELSKEFNPDIYNSNPEIKTYEYTYSEPVTVMDIVNTEPVVDTTTNNTTEDNSGAN